MGELATSVNVISNVASVMGGNWRAFLVRGGRRQLTFKQWVFIWQRRLLGSLQGAWVTRYMLCSLGLGTGRRQTGSAIGVINGEDAGETTRRYWGEEGADN